jgi:hypothetical protein
MKVCRDCNIPVSHENAAVAHFDFERNEIYFLCDCCRTMIQSIRKVINAVG